MCGCVYVGPLGIMLRQFFWDPVEQKKQTLVVAYGGLMLIVLHAAVHGWIKVAVNSFFGDF